MRRREGEQVARESKKRVREINKHKQEKKCVHGSEINSVCVCVCDSLP